MSRKILFTLVAAVAMFGGLQSALAHHSYAMFDRGQRLELTGTVSKFDWRNPHVFIYVEVPDENTGEVVEWAVETGSRNMLRRMGWSHLSLQEGDVVELVVNPRVDGEAGGGLVSASVNGEKIGNR